MASSSHGIRLFMVGDVMLARGMDMIQKYSCDPKLYESNGLNAHDYVSLATSVNGPIPSAEKRQISYSWGDTIHVLEEKKPDVKIINLETSVTTNKSPWPEKGIHYKMHPGNLEVIKSANIDCCVLSNNHSIDWGFKGLRETLRTFQGANLKFVGAGKNISEAVAPAIFDVPGKGRVLVFAGGHQSSGVPERWRAKADREGINIIDIHHPSKALADIKALVRQYHRNGDIVVLSIHWGGNWGFDLEPYTQKFARAVIDEAGVDVIHGHSSHHVKGIEVYKQKLIIYGCGDFLNDYEGISGHDEYRGDLALMYFADIEPVSGRLAGLTMVPTQTKFLRVNLAKAKDADWLKQTMSRECKKFGCDAKLVGDELQLVYTP